MSLSDRAPLSFRLDTFLVSHCASFQRLPLTASRAFASHRIVSIPRTCSSLSFRGAFLIPRAAFRTHFRVPPRVPHYAPRTAVRLAVRFPHRTDFSHICQKYIPDLPQICPLRTAPHSASRYAFCTAFRIPHRTGIIEHRKKKVSAANVGVYRRTRRISLIDIADDNRPRRSSNTEEDLCAEAFSRDRREVVPAKRCWSLEERQAVAVPPAVIPR